MLAHVVMGNKCTNVAVNMFSNVVIIVNGYMNDFFL